MLHILLVILKIIGIVFASVLGLLLFLFFVFAFGPVRYRVFGEADERKNLEGHISWLFFVLRCKIQYTSEKGLIWYIRVFGYLFASNEEAFIAKKREEKNKKVTKAIEARQMKANPKEVSIRQLVIEEEEVSVKNEQPMIRKEKISIIQKGKKFIYRIKVFFVELKRKITSIPEKLVSMKENIIKKKNRFLEIKEYFVGEQNKEVMVYILSHLKKMLCHILPNHFHGRVEFGLEDPYTMGQILALLGILMPIYQDKLTVIPDFEEEKLKGDVSLKGNIVPGYLVLQLFILIMNKEVRRVIKEGKEHLLGGRL